MNPIETAAQLLVAHGPTPPAAVMYAAIRPLVPSPRDVADMWDAVLVRLAELCAEADRVPQPGKAAA